MLFSFLAAVAVVAVLGVAYLSTPYFSARVGPWLTHKSGRHIALDGKIQMHLWRREPRIILSGVKVGNAEWGSGPSMFEAGRIEFSVKPWELLRGRIVLPELIVEKPKLLLEKNAKGEANWNFTQNPQAAVVKQPVPESRYGMPVIHHLWIEDGSVTYNDPADNIATTVAISSVQGESGKKENIHVSGKGTYQKEPFLLDLTGASVLQLRESDEPYPFSLKTTIGDTTAEVEGTVQDPVKMEALNVQLNLKGANAADLFKLTGIALLPTPPYKVEGHLTRQKDDWHFEKFSGHMGSSDLSGDIIWHPAAAPHYLEGTFVSDNLDMADLAGFIGADKKPADPNRVIPDTPLDISRLMAMNADVEFRGKHVKQSTVLDDMRMDVHLKDGVLHLKPLSFGVAQGRISADVQIEGRKNPPVTAMDVSFSKLSLNALFASLAERFGKENVSAGLLGGTAQLKGSGKSLRDMLATADGDIGIGLQGGELSRLLLDIIGLDLFRAAGLILSDRDEPVPMHCVLARFDVHDGIMQTRQFLIDTDVVSITAEGGINLRDETLDLRLRTLPKEPSPLSLHSPLVARGTLKHPKAGVDTAALAARGGVATALAIVAPPAAALAFIEPGLGEKGGCAAFVRQFKQETGAHIP